MPLIPRRKDRIHIYRRIYDICPKARSVFERDSQNVMHYLLGKSAADLGANEMMNFWVIAGIAIENVYRKVTSSRSGIG